MHHCLQYLHHRHNEPFYLLRMTRNFFWFTIENRYHMQLKIVKIVGLLLHLGNCLHYQDWTEGGFQ